MIGWTPDKLSNHLLTETLETFANRSSGALEGFLGVIYYPDRASAQRALDRITQMTRASFNGRLPDSFKSEIFEYADARFDFRIEYERPHPNWKPFPNPIKQEEVSIDLSTWTTDKRTGKAIERQARLMGRTPGGLHPAHHSFDARR